MMKWLMHLVMIALVAGAWVMFSNSGKEVKAIEREIAAEYEKGDPDGKVASLDEKLKGVEGERTFTGVLLTFLSAGLVGIFFVVYLLPFFAQRVTHAVYDSAEMVEKDIMHDARSLMAQGDYAGAIAAFQQAAAAEPLNRLPWVEIAKIQRDHLHNPAAAIQTIRHALESQEWEINDAAFFLFRLAEMYDEHEGDRASARAIMQQVVDEFPATRHSANAKHKLHEWDVEEEAAKRHADEQQFIAQSGAAAPAEPPARQGGAARYELPPTDEDA
jgi:tetratricopeptide (TPR) repeat protein